MAGTIAADTLTHSTAGSLTTDYIVNGSAKAWANLNGTGTIALRDSLNITSVTDNSTGNYTFNFASNMANANYSFVQMNAGAAAYGSYGVYDQMFTAPTSSSFRTTTRSNGGVAVDIIQVNDAAHGDLA